MRMIITKVFELVFEIKAPSHLSNNELISIIDNEHGESSWRQIAISEKLFAPLQ